MGGEHGCAVVVEPPESFLELTRLLLLSQNEIWQSIFVPSDMYDPNSAARHFGVCPPSTQ